MKVSRKLGSTSDFIQKAKELGLTISLDTSKGGGLRVYWLYSGSPEALKDVKNAFRKDGIVANHHFKKVKP